MTARQYKIDIVRRQSETGSAAQLNAGAESPIMTNDSQESGIDRPAVRVWSDKVAPNDLVGENPSETNKGETNEIDNHDKAFRCE